MDDLYLDGALVCFFDLFVYLYAPVCSSWNRGRGRQTRAQGEQEEEEQEAG